MNPMKAAFSIITAALLCTPAMAKIPVVGNTETATYCADNGEAFAEMGGTSGFSNLGGTLTWTGGFAEACEDSYVGLRINLTGKNDGSFTLKALLSPNTYPAVFYAYSMDGGIFYSCEGIEQNTNKSGTTKFTFAGLPGTCKASAIYFAALPESPGGYSATVYAATVKGGKPEATGLLPQLDCTFFIDVE
jgi:hypothetical protein